MAYKDKYLYLHLDELITISMKLDDDGVVLEAHSGGEEEAIASTWKTYAEMGVEVIHKEDE